MLGRLGGWAGGCGLMMSKVIGVGAEIVETTFVSRFSFPVIKIRKSFLFVSRLTEWKRTLVSKLFLISH